MNDRAKDKLADLLEILGLEEIDTDVYRGRNESDRMHRLFGTPAPVGRAALSTPGPFVYCTGGSHRAVEDLFPAAVVRPLSNDGPIDAYLVSRAAGDF